MGYLFKNGKIVTLNPAVISREDLRIEGNRISERAARIESRPGDEVVDLQGKLVMPGMACAHTHLYSSLARGMPAPARSPRNFVEVLELIWWRLDRALDEETIYWSALSGAAEAVRAGTTCLFDHHASPCRIGGSLGIVRQALDDIGMRGVLCYEITDRGTALQRDEGIRENRSFLEWAARNPEGNFRGMVGAHASFTLGNESLRSCAELMKEYRAGLHIHVAEDRCDVEDCRARYGAGIVERLSGSGALNDRTVLAHATHLDTREAARAREEHVWLAHNPRSNMNNRVGYAPVATFGDRLALGTDGIGADMFEEARFAFFRGTEAGAGLGAEGWLRALASNQEMASRQFGVDLRSLNADSAADLIVLDYASPTPMTSDNLAWHFVFGLSSASVESVMIAGRFVVRDRVPAFDSDRVGENARRAAGKLWARMAEL